MDNKKIIGALIAVVVVAGVVFAAGCVEPTEDGEQVTVALPIMPWAYWTSFYTAENQGYYAEEGLSVDFVYPPEGGFGVIKQVAAGNALFGYAGGDSVLTARSNEIPVIAIYQDGHSSSWSIIAKKDISSLEELDGKSVAIQGPNNPLHLASKAMLAKAGVNPDNVTWVPVGGQAMISTFLGGKADAITGNELYEIILKKQNADFNIWYARDYGINFVPPVILISEDTLKNNPELVEKFLRATKKGEEYAIAHPEDSVNAFISNFNPSANKEIETELWKVYKEGVIQPGKYPLGQFTKTQWEATQDTLYELGAMEKKVDIESAYTEEFLGKI